MYSQEGPDIFGFMGRMLLLGALLYAALAVLPMLVHALDQSLITVRSHLVEETTMDESQGFADLPFTKHAMEQDHGGWNAMDVAVAFDSGRCVPQKYECVAKDYDVFWCPVNGVEIALLIGHTVKQVITGFAKSPGEWSSQACK